MSTNNPSSITSLEQEIHNRTRVSTENNVGYQQDQEDLTHMSDQIKGFVTRSSDPTLAQELFNPIIELWTVHQQALGHGGISAEDAVRRMLESYKVFFERFPTAFQTLPPDAQAYLSNTWIPDSLVLDEKQRQDLSLSSYQNEAIRIACIHQFNRICGLTNKDSLYQAVELCKISEPFSRSMEIAGVQKSQRLAYQNWRDRYSAAQERSGPAQSDLPSLPKTSEPVTLDDASVARWLSDSTNPVLVQELVDHLRLIDRAAAEGTFLSETGSAPGTILGELFRKLVIVYPHTSPALQLSLKERIMGGILENEQLAVILQHLERHKEIPDLYRAVVRYGVEEQFLERMRAAGIQKSQQSRFQNWRSNPTHLNFMIAADQLSDVAAPASEVITSVVPPSTNRDTNNPLPPVAAVAIAPKIILDSSIDTSVMQSSEGEDFGQRCRRLGDQATTHTKRRLYQILTDMWEVPQSHETETKSEYKKRYRNGHATFIPFLIETPIFDFDEVDFDSITNTIRHYYSAEGVDNKAATRRIIERANRDTPPYLLFQGIHLYNLNKEFEVSLKEGIHPAGMRQSYYSWKLKNANFIENSYNAYVAWTDIDTLGKMITGTDEFEDKKFYAKVRCFYQFCYDEELPVSTDILPEDETIKFFEKSHVEINFVQLVLKNRHLIEGSGDNRSVFQNFILTPFAKHVKNSSLSSLSIGDLFNFAQIVDQDKFFERILDEGQFPGVTYTMYEAWKVNPTSFEQGLAAKGALPTDNAPEPVSVILEEREMQSAAIIDPLLADSRVTYIDVHHPLVTSGNQTQSMGYSPVNEDKNLETGLNQGDDFQDRTRTLLKVLVGDAQSGVQKITVRWDRRNANDDNVEGRPYNLIDIEMEGGTRSRVAVCDYNGHMTYVERDAAKMEDQETLQISALRANRKVWTAVHVNDKQWCERIQEILYTPLDTLTPELKNRSYWHGLKGLLTETFAATVMATGNLPSPTDDRAIEHGPLAGRTTYSRMYFAAHRGTVHGIEPKTTYRKLFAELSSGPMPELNQFINRAPLQAVDILANWRDIKAELDEEIAINDYADLVKIDGRDHRAIDLAFQFGAVQGLDKIKGLEQAMTDKTQRPKSLKAFLRLVESYVPMALAA